MPETVLLERRGKIATLTLNRPGVLNALNPEMARVLHAAVSELQQDDSVRCVIIRGAGDHFMAGGDVAFFRESLDDLHTDAQAALSELFEYVHGTIRILCSMNKPVIASAHGAVAGIGVSLVLACDLAIATEDTVFQMAYNRIGTCPDGGGTFFLPRIAGIKKAMELTLLGEPVDADNACSMGLVNRVVASSGLEKETLSLAEKLIAGPALAQANTKALLQGSLHASLDAQLAAEQKAFAQCAGSADFAEGVTAFCEKRKPRFGSDTD